MSLTMAQLEQTDWAKRFKADSPVSYAQGIALAIKPNLEVSIAHTDENGDWRWVIVAVDAPGFWMDALSSRQEAINLCDQLNWKVTYEIDHQTGTKIDREAAAPTYNFKDEQAVKFDNHVMTGTGIVRGVSNIPQAVIGATYIIEVIESSEAIPNDSYPFKFIPMFECHMEAIEPS